MTPTSFLRRAKSIFADRLAIIDGEQKFTYGDFYSRAARLSGGLLDRGIQEGDRIAVLASNSHVMLEVHYGVPLANGVIVPLNTRLSEAELAEILVDSAPRMLICSPEHATVGRNLSELLNVDLLVADGPESDYERLLAGSAERIQEITDEATLLALNYTSGTTGRPKGAMYHHRGAFLQSLAMALHNQLQPDSRYLWTLPMFHCNGWSFTWAVTGVGGVHVCLRSLNIEQIWKLLCNGDATHFSAAPTVLTMLVASEAAQPLREPITVTTGGAPPSPTLISRLNQMNIRVTHLYGMTETFGPIMVNIWRDEWNHRSREDQAHLLARQGVPNIIAEPVRVLDAVGADVAADGTTMGELVVRGNDLFSGYYNDEIATTAASVEGYFRTGDVGVVHRDGYVELRDRAKDIVISGGENVSSVEVEQTLDSHPAVLESAIVGAPDEKWGEIPVAFVCLRPEQAVSEEELISYVRQRMAHFKAPKRIIFADLPKSGTGKIQKHLLRSRLASESPDGH